MTSAFDPQILLSATTEEVLERRAPLPVGDYTATVGEVTARQWNSRDGSKSGMALDVPLIIEVPAEVQADLGLNPTLTFKDSIMLDLTETGGIDYSKGKNGRLRLYRDALDMNKKGESFSPMLMTGRYLKVKIGHEDYEGWPRERVGSVSQV
jgi:hypothetical protein